MAKEKDTQKLQQRYMELQLIDHQMRQIQKQMQMIESQMIEVENTKIALSELEKIESGSEILAPVSSGIFITAVLSDNKKLKVNVGAGTVVEKTIPEVISLIEEQEVEIKNAYDSLAVEMQKLTNKALSLEDDLKNV